MGHVTNSGDELDALLITSFAVYIGWHRRRHERRITRRLKNGMESSRVAKRVSSDREREE